MDPRIREEMRNNDRTQIRLQSNPHHPVWDVRTGSWVINRLPKFVWNFSFPRLGVSSLPPNTAGSLLAELKKDPIISPWRQHGDPGQYRVLSALGPEPQRALRGRGDRFHALHQCKLSICYDWSQRSREGVDWILGGESHLKWRGGIMAACARGTRLSIQSPEPWGPGNFPILEIHL